MKKFSKLLFLLLALVVIATAFTVVALADTSEELTPVLAEALDFEEYSNGDVIKNSTTKKGQWMVGEADNGNKYLVSSYDGVDDPDAKSEQYHGFISLAPLRLVFRNFSNLKISCKFQNTALPVDSLKSP